MGDIADYTRGEPAPVRNDNPSIHDLVVADLASSQGRAVTRLSEVLGERREFGLKKYGTLLQADNGRDPLADLIDELCDAVVYARQHLEESQINDDLVWRAKITYEKLLDLTLNVVDTWMQGRWSRDGVTAQHIYPDLG